MTGPLEVLRTPDERFADLPGWTREPSYALVDAGDGSGPLRMAYVDAGPADGPTVLLLHGQPTWSFLYRHVIDVLVAEGARVIAPDHIGFGRSDKPVSPYDYTLTRHVAWTRSLVEVLDLRDVTLVCQDWGGPIGLSALTGDPDRYGAVVAANTILHTASPDLAGRLTWAVHGEGESRVVIEEWLLDHLLHTPRAPRLRASDFVAGGVLHPLPPEVLRVYDAPFPSDEHAAGLRQMTALLPLTRNDVGAAIGDPATRGWETVFAQHVPGAAGLPHRVLEGAGHFLQEDAGPELAAAVVDLLG